MDDGILSALPLTSAEIGERFAPPEIKDKSSWARRKIAKLIEAGKAIRDMVTRIIFPTRDAVTRIIFPTRDERPAVVRFGYDKVMRRDYKSPHAYRGTPAKAHFSKFSRVRRFFHI
jgi:hypothetical protein